MGKKKIKRKPGFISRDIISKAKSLYIENKYRYFIEKEQYLSQFPWWKRWIYRGAIYLIEMQESFAIVFPNTIILIQYYPQLWFVLLLPLFN